MIQQQRYRDARGERPVNALYRSCITHRRTAGVPKPKLAHVSEHLSPASIRLYTTVSHFLSSPVNYKSILDPNAHCVSANIFCTTKVSSVYLRVLCVSAWTNLPLTHCDDRANVHNQSIACLLLHVSRAFPVASKTS